MALHDLVLLWLERPLIDQRCVVFVLQEVIFVRIEADALGVCVLVEILHVHEDHAAEVCLRCFKALALGACRFARTRRLDDQIVLGSQGG